MPLGKVTRDQRINELQKNPKNIRNICILAHVDHGKTTLADSLVATCGIISQRLAGKIRYMDSRDDEQERGITMKSSSISLHYQHKSSDYLINVIDSPGHVDFSGEVSTAVRLCDGCIVLVDVVEGVCPQTQVVLRQAWLEKLKPVLVLNKMDRLITELRYTPIEAYLRVRELLEEVNAVIGSLHSSDVVKKSDELYSNSDATIDEELRELDLEDEHLYFSPTAGNVVFASASDCWGFRIEHFAQIFSKKLGINEKVLGKTLWGDYYVNTKTKKIMKGANAKGKKPLFVQFILENLWSVYDAIVMNTNEARSERIVESLNVKVNARDKRSLTSDARNYLRVVCTQWLPLSSAILSSVCDLVPSPCHIVEERVEKLMSHNFPALPLATRRLKQNFMECDGESDVVIALVSKMMIVDSKCLPHKQNRLITVEDLKKKKEAARARYEEMQRRLEQGESREMIEQETATMKAMTQSEESKEKEDESKMIAFARVFSGQLQVGQRYYVLGPKYDPASLVEGMSDDEVVASNDHVTTCTVDELYYWMGRNVDVCHNASAGSIVGIGGMDGLVLNSATISSTLHCSPFNPLFVDSAPILRVAVEPKVLSEQRMLVEGLKKLNEADPCVEVSIEDTGEHVIAAAGEVHLRRCLEDLQKRYCKIELNVSEPIVPFRETLIPPPRYDVMNELIANQEKDLVGKWQKEDRRKDKNCGGEEESSGVVEGGESVSNNKKNKSSSKIVKVQTPNGQCSIHVQAIPLPEGVAELLEANSVTIKHLTQLEMRRKEAAYRDHHHQDHVTAHKQPISDEQRAEISRFRSALRDRFGAKPKWSWAVDSIWSFGPRHCGPNVLLNKVPGYRRPSLWLDGDEEAAYREHDQSVVTGFQLATLRGPICEEPLHGVCFVVHEWTTAAADGEAVDEDADDDDTTGDERSCSTFDNYGPISGQLISTVKEGLRRAFQLQPQRLMVAMYSCKVQANSEVLGKVYAVLGKRGGEVKSEEMNEGTNVFTIEAHLPIAKSFGFVDEIRKKSSGMAQPQLTFSHWQTLPNDPFWVPTTEEEISHFGEKADHENEAGKYVRDVKKRKGLYVEKTVEHADKQRTIGKNK